MANASTSRKSRGAFFTPPTLTRFLTNWAVRSPDDKVLEPSCGDAAFLVEIAHRLRALGCKKPLAQSITGVELHQQSANGAAQRLSNCGFDAEIKAADFFDLDGDATFDAVVGNPPYVRFHGFSGEDRIKAMRRAIQAGVRLSALASSWAAFLVHSTRFLKPEGRLGLVLPGELLAVKYAGPVRRFLLERFREVRLVLFEELVFDGVQEEVVLLLAEGEGPNETFEVTQLENANGLKTERGFAWRRYSARATDKWTTALIGADELDVYRTFVDSADFERLIDWGDSYLGIVTGNNAFFTLTQREADLCGLTEGELVKISPPGSRHLRNLAFTASEWRSLAAAGKRCLLFSPASDALSDAASRYVQRGESKGIPSGYKCRNRFPWWRVPLVRKPDLFLTYMDRDRPRFVTNEAGAYPLNSLYGVSLAEDRAALGTQFLPYLALNSLTLLGAEMVGRSYGGGLLKLEPGEADRLPIPSVDVARAVSASLNAVRGRVVEYLEGGDLRAAVNTVDKVLLEEGAGFTAQEVARIRNARTSLFGRRQTRANGSNGKR